ncbi:hypothetical protein [Desulfarculus baarsii]|uniref:hypothetical protein n=1 Tax=Desulfarculus baarsii TaxID=453230 RepID=UPI0011D10C6B|nr:hypothetical protein [Desulfarculus baarsii]
MKVDFAMDSLFRPAAAARRFIFFARVDHERSTSPAARFSSHGPDALGARQFGQATSSRIITPTGEAG